MHTTLHTRAAKSIHIEKGVRYTCSYLSLGTIDKLPILERLAIAVNTKSLWCWITQEYHEYLLTHRYVSLLAKQFLISLSKWEGPEDRWTIYLKHRGQQFCTKWFTCTAQFRDGPSTVVAITLRPILSQQNKATMCWKGKAIKPDSLIRWMSDVNCYLYHKRMPSLQWLVVSRAYWSCCCQNTHGKRTSVVFALSLCSALHHL